MTWGNVAATDRDLIELHCVISLLNHKAEIRYGVVTMAVRKQKNASDQVKHAGTRREQAGSGREKGSPR